MNSHTMTGPGTRCAMAAVAAIGRHAWPLLLCAGSVPLTAWPAAALESPADMAALYAATVDKRLIVPPQEVQRYGSLAVAMLERAGLTGLAPQYLVLVDRSPQVQAVFVYWRPAGAFPQLVGASPASTGRPSGFEHFQTPTGVFSHDLRHPDFRSEGTKNSQGVRGYGAKGMRVYDFGWQQALKGWGNRGLGLMRLQMHTTDPQLLEPRLGLIQSKGCIRIPATLNRLIDRYGLLDADYSNAVLEGKSLWMLAPDRTPVPWPGRYLIVVDSLRDTRPPWSPAPLLRRSRPATKHQPLLKTRPRT